MFHHVERLDAADAGLDMRAERLDAQIDAIHPHGRHRIDPRRVEAARVQLDRNLRIMRIEAAQNMLHQPDIDQRQAVGTAATKGDARDPTPSAQPRGDQCSTCSNAST